jgi:DNA processing protein
MAGLHPDRARRLVARYGSASAVLRAAETGKIDVSRRAAEAIVRSPAEIAEVLGTLGIRAVWRGTDEYPGVLGGIPDAPDVLFVRGAIPVGPAVAIVGTRTCTRYGRSLARAYGRVVARAGWTVISGLARGIDAEAHQGTLEGCGRGVAVLGSGSNVIYPAEHRDLHDALIGAGGAAVTEYPPGTPPEGWRFPPRNRIVAGLSGAVVVVEAGVTGGALITAAAALDQGRSVFAVPGDVDREASRGCNLLIRDGAVPVLDPDDLIEALSLVLGLPVEAPAGRQFPASGDAEVVAAVHPSGTSVEDLAAATGLPVADVLAAVGRLEATGRLQRRDGSVVPGTGG